LIPPEILHRLRAAQHHAAHEQQLLSGRDWILVACFAQLLSALYPLFAWFNHLLFGAGPRAGLHPGIDFAVTITLAAAFAALWLWARHAPFRASLTAVIIFVLVQGALGFVDPEVLLAGAVVKALVLVGLLHAMRTGYLRHRAL
jgi:hypothetical protein